MALSSLPAEVADAAVDDGLRLADAIGIKAGIVLPLEAPTLDGVIPDSFQALSLHQLRSLVYFLGAYSSGQELEKPRKIALKGEPRKVWQLLTAAASLLSNWPDSFHGFLLTQFDRRSGETGIKERFGYLYTAIYRDFSAPAFGFLRTEFEMFLQEHWDDVLSGRNRRLSPEMKESQAYLPASIVMRMLHVPRHVLETGIANGTIQGRIFPLASGRQRIVVARSDLGCIAALWDWIDLKATVQMLGLPEKRVLELLSGKMLRGQAAGPGEQWKILRVNIDRLLADFRIAATQEVISPQGLVRMDGVLRHYLVGGVSFVDLAKALLSGVIPFEWRSDLTALRDLWLDKERLNRWLQPSGDLLTIPVVASLLGVKQQVAYHLVRKGLIYTKPFGRKGQLVTKDDVRRFQVEYVLARDLAKMLRTSPRYLIHRLSAAGVNPVTGPEIDGCRQVIYLRLSLLHVPIPAPIIRALDQLGSAQTLGSN
ncbi:MAG: helix-turn-helix domain-containing protein [Moraxellaceae bacterium]